MDNKDMAFISFSKRLRIYLRDQFTCVYCKKAMNPLSNELSLDHVNGKMSDENFNLVTCCTSCNSSKGNMSPEEFLAKITLRKQNDIQKQDDNRSAEIEKITTYQIDEIIKAIIKNHDVTFNQLIGNRRKKKLVLARIEVIKSLREKGLTFVDIGRLLHRDHTTIIHHNDKKNHLT